MYFDTGVGPSNIAFPAQRKPCVICGWGNNVRVYSIAFSDEKVEAKLKISDDGTFEVIDHTGASFAVKFAHCPSCGAAMRGGPK